MSEGTRLGPEYTFDAIANLPASLEYTGEFGAELILFTPFCNWLSQVGLLRNRTVVTYAGMKCFYDDMKIGRLIEKPEKRSWVAPTARPEWMPVKDEHDFDGRGKSPFLVYPDLRKKFQALPLLPDLNLREKPLLIIHNKYNVEWGARPINFLRLWLLEEAFKVLSDSFTIVYIRHGMGTIDNNFSTDANEMQIFPDRALLEKYPDIISFDDLYTRHRQQGGLQDLNTFKNVLYSRCYHFVTAQGGGAHHIAAFSGSIMMILHRRGSESQWAYTDGYYDFMAGVPPVRCVFSSVHRMAEALGLLKSVKVIGDRVFLLGEGRQYLEEYAAIPGKTLKKARKDHPEG
ncbi:hypothetical protein [Roseomonas indoligenes]|uniref:Uncharacterized protein n=1 Tax=Roseomonas indoligenes TaxID=2820811 RepID=A0A940N1G4_9PROT|nr:hypothetical protein [Pararoseomonas indoligenes]MBP0492517.1 hypothetical protein [Pararoseomonas indoligenes]